jgi:hypothetical protein
VNKRIDMGAYVEMIYGWCLSRVIHFIVALGLAYPLIRIFIMKYDYSDACRRVAHPLTFSRSSIDYYLRTSRLPFPETDIRRIPESPDLVFVLRNGNGPI